VGEGVREKTDDLIDQIVYKLYGLTEEEIAVVKGEGLQEAEGEEEGAAN